MHDLLLMGMMYAATDGDKKLEPLFNGPFRSS